jgi:hypothetical protein
MFANFEKYQVVIDDSEIAVLSGREETTDFLNTHFKLSVDDIAKLFDGHDIKYGKNVIHLKTCGRLRQSSEYDDMRKKQKTYMTTPLGHEDADSDLVPKHDDKKLFPKINWM